MELELQNESIVKSIRNKGKGKMVHRPNTNKYKHI